VLAILLNINRDPKKPLARPQDFDPFAEPKKPTKMSSKESMNMLKKVFIDKKG